ncbi:fluoride efflux transporter CrcB [Geoalkalibacter halelectricus]|uniref:fluoride efflux transporter CrcB n=1 Tax=Geoalkalibacter halelectricus TaxID=2847045 RepID=UPI003D20A1D4
MTGYFSNLLAVLVGSAIGGALRYWISGLVQGRMGDRFPWGTLAVNVTGSFLVGILAVLATTTSPLAVGEAQKFLIVGICGSYTTVSSFALQTLALARNAQWRSALGNIVASLGFCMLGVWLGFYLAGRVFAATGGLS